ncbi:MAG: GIY-YIG nuclease family protein [Patescibacteria group bacterium]
MYYVYFLASEKNKDLYVGSTENVITRLNRHNYGKVKSTKGYKPWKLLGYEKYTTRGEAVKQEKFFKTGQQKEKLKQKYGLVAKW